MTEITQDILSSLRGLFEELMARPLLEMTQGCLPFDNALYVFYFDDEPVLVGSAPHVDELQLLSPSVRLSGVVRISNFDGVIPSQALRLRPRSLDRPRRSPVKARWLEISAPKTRMMLEIYTAQKLGLSFCHPEVKSAIIQPAWLHAAETTLPPASTGL